MLNLFRAEWQKVIGNRWVVGGLVWVFPAGAVGIWAIMMVVALFAPPNIQHSMGLAAVDTAPQWTGAMIAAWSLPNQMGGRFIILAFTAVMFAGEYQWGTWKNLLPRRRRIPVMLTKFVTLGAFTVVSFAATSLLIGVGLALPVTLAGGTYGPPIAEALADGFLGDFAIQIMITFTSTVLGACYGALAAMITRNVLGSLLLSAGFMTLEMLSIGVLGLLSTLFDAPRLMALFRWTPTYNISNIVTTLNNEPTIYRFLTELHAENSPAGSLLVLAVWIVGLVGLALFLFRRQDIT